VQDEIKGVQQNDDTTTVRLENGNYENYDKQPGYDNDKISIENKSHDHTYITLDDLNR